LALEEQELVPTKQQQKVRAYGPPAVAVMLVALITVTILPSSLNLPQTNPSTVLEYAPIPPDDEAPPITQSGSLSSLSAAGSSSLTTAQSTPPPLNLLAKELPPIQQQKSCVEGRQTEDPNSPPCQSFFAGDNFGETWQGVSGEEITILYTAQVGTIIDQGQGTAEPTPPAGTYCDVDLLDCDGDGKPDDDAHMWMKILNAFSRYFNARYQTYNRHVHFWMYWTLADSPATRRGDAADNWERLKPFGVLLNLWHSGYQNEYIAALAHREVSIFGAFQGEPRSYYQQYAPKIWSYWPDVENWADMFTGYLCNKVANTPVNHAGSGFSGDPRVYGLLSTRDPSYQNFQYFTDLVKQGVKSCGITFAKHLTFRNAGFWFNNENRGEDRVEAETNMAEFQSAGVNTIIWTAGAETHHSEAAGKQRYFPEWVVAGDADLDGRGYATRQDQDAWQFAWTQSYQLRADNRENDPGWQAYKEADPDGTNENWAIPMYRDLFMLMTAIQVAGPRLSPPQVDAGMHAIQRRESNSPYIASFWFKPGDYTGVKDGNEMFYDPDAQPPGVAAGGNQRGCYRMVQGGARFAADRWAAARGAGIDVPGYNQPDPCNGYNGVGVAFDPG
jgi:hypothetical protein